MNAERETKSVSSETTFDSDISDKAELVSVLLRHCDRVAARLRREGLSARGVTLKLRLPDFSLRTRSRGGLKATQLAPRLFAAALPLLEAQPDGAAYRLLGVAATELGLPKGPTTTTSSAATVAARNHAKRRLRTFATSSAAPRSSEASPSGPRRDGRERLLGAGRDWQHLEFAQVGVQGERAVVEFETPGNAVLVKIKRQRIFGGESVAASSK